MSRREIAVVWVEHDLMMAYDARRRSSCEVQRPQLKVPDELWACPPMRRDVLDGWLKGKEERGGEAGAELRFAI